MTGRCANSNTNACLGEIAVNDVQNIHRLADADYACMPHPRLCDDLIAAEAVRASHIEPIRRWRNAQMDILRQTEPISPEAQLDYFDREVWPDKACEQPRTLLLSVAKDGAIIGYGGLVHISWPNRRAEVSFLLDPEPPRRDPEIADLYARFLRLMQRFAFQDLGLNRLTSEIYRTRTLHIDVLEASGFIREGTMRQHVIQNGKPIDALIHGCLREEWEGP